MRLGKAMLAGVLALGLCGLTVSAEAAPKETAPPHVLKIRGQSADQGDRGLTIGGGLLGNGIRYHGGPVMTGEKHAYAIWYGSWSGNSATTIISDFLSSVGGSPYFNINTTYYDGANVKVANAVKLSGSTTDSYSQGSTNLSDAAITAVVASAITSGRLPNDPNGVYFVLTSKDVSKSGFLTQYCGWHDYTTVGSTVVKYSFVGDPTGPNVSACAAQTTASPNGNVGADAMVSVIAHELEEAATDPQLNAWYDVRGYENADKCAWKFGTTTTANGYQYNMTLGARRYLIQQNWLNASGGKCVLAY